MPRRDRRAAARPRCGRRSGWRPCSAAAPSRWPARSSCCARARPGPRRHPRGGAAAAHRARGGAGRAGRLRRRGRPRPAPGRAPRRPGRGGRGRQHGPGRPARRRAGRGGGAGARPPRGRAARAVGGRLRVSRTALTRTSLIIVYRAAGARAVRPAVRPARRARGRACWRSAPGSSAPGSSCAAWPSTPTRSGTAAFPGLVLADGLGFAAPLGAARHRGRWSPPASAWLARRDRDRYDSRTALVLVAALAAGVILASRRLPLRRRRRDPAVRQPARHRAVATSLWAAGGRGRRDRRRPRCSAAAGSSPASTRARRRALGVRSRPARRGPARPRRPGGRRGALGHRRAAGHRAARRPRRDHAAAVLDRLRPWQLASVVLVALEGVGRPLALGRDQRAARRRDRRARRRGVRARGRRPRAGARRAAARRGRRARPRCSRSRCSSPAAAAAARPATAGLERRRDHDPARRHRPRASAATRSTSPRSCAPNTDPHEYEPRPARRRSTPPAPRSCSQRRRARRLDGQGRRRGRRRRRPSSTSAPTCPTACPASSAARGVPLRPALVARPAQRRGRGRRASATRSAAPTRRSTAPSRAQRRGLPARRSARARPPGIARCFAAVPPAQRKLVTDHDAFGYFAHRYGIAGRRRRHPVADHPGAALGRRHRAAQRADPARARARRSSPRRRSTTKLAQAIARQTGARADYELYGDTLGPAGSPGATYLGMERANADAMVRGFTGGRRARARCRP